MSNTAVDWIPATIGDSGYYPPYSLPPLTPQVGTFDNVIGGAGAMQSANYVTGATGWTINGDGSAEFNNVTVRGTLIAGKIDIPDTTTAASFHVDATGRMWSGANASNFATAPFSVDASGNVSTTTVTAAGNITLTGSGAFRTAASGIRIEMTSAADDRINFYTGNVNETFPGRITVVSSGVLEVRAPAISGAPSSSRVTLEDGSLKLQSSNTSNLGGIIMGSTGSFLVDQSNLTSFYSLLPLWGRDSAFSGSPPSVGGGQFLVQCGTTVVAMNAGGAGFLTFPSAFPNGLVTFVAMGGDSNIPGVNTGAIVFSLNQGGTNDRTGVTVQSWDSKNLVSYVSNNVRVNWIAIGF